TRQGRLLRLMAALETDRGRLPGRDEVLAQSPPRSVWWEVTPGGMDTPLTGPIHVTNLPGYPAPAWDLAIDAWPCDPEPRPVKLQVWCGDELPPVAQRITVTPGPSAGAPQVVEVDG